MSAIVVFLKGLEEKLVDLVHTFMKHITQWRIVQDDNFTQIRFDGADIFYIRPIPVCAMLSIVTSLEVFSVLF